MTTTSTLTDPGLIDIGILGPLRVREGLTQLTIGPRREQALMELLVLGAGHVQPAERLIERLWDGAPPDGAPTTLRSYISHLRGDLGGPGGIGARLVTRGAGYALEVDPDSIDLNRFRSLVMAGRAHLDEGENEVAQTTLEEALTLWRGDPLAEIAHLESTEPVLAELQELRLSAIEGRLQAMVQGGRHVDALPGLEVLVREEPLRETPREMQMIALYRSGRAPEALATHRDYARVLADELGIDPSARLDRLFQRMLARDPALDPQDSLAAPAAPALLAPVRTVAVAPGDGATDAVQLATQLIESLREVSHAASLAACELMRVLQASDVQTPRLETSRVPLSA